MFVFLVNSGITLLYPSLCWNDAETGYRVVTPYTWQCFLWAAATVIFGFWSIILQKNACSTHCRHREKKCCPKFILTPSNWVVFKGYDQTNTQQTRKQQGITFLKLRGAPQFWKMTRTTSESKGRSHEKKLLFFWILSKLPPPPPKFGQLVQLFPTSKFKIWKSA